MNSNFYTDKLLLITPIPTSVDNPGVECIHGDMKKLFVELIKNSLNGTIHKRVLIINDETVLSNNSKLEACISMYADVNIKIKDVFFKKVVHDGLPEKCTVDDSIILCSSWTFPFISNSYRRSNNLYEDCYSHRLTIKTLPSV